MEFPKAVIIGVGLTDLKIPPSAQHFFAEVVLLDKTNESVSPLLFQLKKEALYGNDDLATISKEMISMHRDAFMMVGEVVEVDKKKKTIFLSNNNTVTYTHLIVAVGTKHSFSESDYNKEFSDGLQTLIDALRVKKIPTNFETLALMDADRRTPRVSSFEPTQGLFSLDIQRLVSHKILKEKGNSFALSLNGIDKRLYEVIV